MIWCSCAWQSFLICGYGNGCPDVANSYQSVVSSILIRGMDIYHFAAVCSTDVLFLVDISTKQLQCKGCILLHMAYDTTQLHTCRNRAINVRLSIAVHCTAEQQGSPIQKMVAFITLHAYIPFQANGHSSEKPQRIQINFIEPFSFWKTFLCKHMVTFDM